MDCFCFDVRQPHAYHQEELIMEVKTFFAIVVLACSLVLVCQWRPAAADAAAELHRERRRSIREPAQEKVAVQWDKRASHPHMNNLVFGRRSQDGGLEGALEPSPLACKALLQSCRKWQLKSAAADDGEDNN